VNLKFLKAAAASKLGKLAAWLRHLGDSGFGVGFDAGRGFFAGAETPMLSRKKLKPLRSESSRLIVDSLPALLLLRQ
jgi:hypothetical protein